MDFEVRREREREGERVIESVFFLKKNPSLDTLKERRERKRERALNRYGHIVRDGRESVVRDVHSADRGYR